MRALRAHLPRARRDNLGLQRLRPLQDRGRPIQLAHDGTDDGRLPLCREAARQRRCSSATARVEVDLYGSLALTGKGHATDRADPARPVRRAARPDRPRRGRRGRSRAIRESGRLSARRRARDRLRRGARPPLPPARAAAAPFSNGMRFTAFDAAGAALDSAVSYSVGGGAVVDEAAVARNAPPEGAWDVPYRYQLGRPTARHRRARGAEHRRHRPRQRARRAVRRGDRRAGSTRSSEAMSACIDRGMAAGGILPGGLNVKRRAPALHRLLTERAERALQDPLTVIDWVNLWALAVNEENAAGGKVVTAPTNGAAGIVPAVLRYYQRFTPARDRRGRRTSSCSPPRRSAPCSRRMPRSPAPRSAARARSASPARWRRRG